MDEQTVISLLRSRDGRGAEELLRLYGPLMRYIIAPILQNAQDREDCLSEAAMRVWDGIGGYAPERGSWTAWLTALTRNTALNFRRRSARGETAELPDSFPSPEPTPEASVLLRERQAALARALKALSSAERALFYRKYYYMQSTAQIASELGTTQRSVEGRLYRLRLKLRRALGGEFHE